MLPSCKITFPVLSNLQALSLQDDYFKSTVAITLKLADHVLTLLLSRMVPKRGHLTVPEAAAALFQYHPLNQTAINRLYVYCLNSSLLVRLQYTWVWCTVFRERKLKEKSWIQLRFELGTFQILAECSYQWATGLTAEELTARLDASGNIAFFILSWLYTVAACPLFF